MSINLNVGIMGHVDSGKTSLAKCLSAVASTAAFDKNPQSQERGITLDLGFSSFTIPIPQHLKNATDAENMQFTLVDCPGHASLIKTIIGGAQIIDIMLLVVDINKGIQTQTAECLVIGEITCKKMIIVLNKIDLIDSENKDITISKMTNKMKKVVSSTAFHNQDVPIIGVSCNIELKTGIEELINCISEFSFIPIRSKEGQFTMAIDHCFGIKGQGTVMTGTILEGSISVNDSINLPQLGTTKKIKSMQMFKKPVQSAIQGDRLGVCVTQFDPKLLERGIACALGHGEYITSAIINAQLIRYFKGSIQTKSKFHITLGYETALANITVFRSKTTTGFSFEEDYLYSESLDNEYKSNQYILLEFEKPIFIFTNSILIGSKLDMDIHKNACRLAFWGKVIASAKNVINMKEKLKIYKVIQKVGIIDRVVNENTIIIKNMFKKETDLKKFLNLKVYLSTGEMGIIESNFGQSGKIKVNIQHNLNVDTLTHQKITVSLDFKKCIYDIDKRIYQ